MVGAPGLRNITMHQRYIVTVSLVNRGRFRSRRPCHRTRRTKGPRARLARTALPAKRTKKRRLGWPCRRRRSRNPIVERKRQLGVTVARRVETVSRPALTWTLTRPWQAAVRETPAGGMTVPDVTKRYGPRRRTEIRRPVRPPAAAGAGGRGPQSGRVASGSLALTLPPWLAEVRPAGRPHQLPSASTAYRV